MANILWDGRTKTLTVDHGDGYYDVYLNVRQPAYDALMLATNKEAYILKVIAPNYLKRTSDGGS